MLRDTDRPAVPGGRDRRIGADQHGVDRGSFAHERAEQGEQSEAPTLSTGTTTVAVAAADGAVIATDRRASLGGRVVTAKAARKVHRVHPTAAVAISGSVGGGQRFAERLRAEADLYETRRGRPMSLTALTETAARTVPGLRTVPLLAGVDEEGSHVVELDGAGGVLRDDYAAGGSGMQLAYGVLEDGHDPGIDLGDARQLAVDAVAVASERDTASGNGATVAEITDAGVEFASDPDPATVRDGEVA